MPLIFEPRVEVVRDADELEPRLLRGDSLADEFVRRVDLGHQFQPVGRHAVALPRRDVVRPHDETVALTRRGNASAASTPSAKWAYGGCAGGATPKAASSDSFHMMTAAERSAHG